MSLLFKDYTDLVLKNYEAKKVTYRLSPLLKRPTPASLLRECLNVYGERKGEKLKKDEPLLRAFFGVPGAGEDYGKLIRNFDINRFKPLQSFIGKEIKNPSETTVELLAWLIDHNPRPLDEAKKHWGKNSDPVEPVDIDSMVGTSDAVPGETGEENGNNINKGMAAGGPVGEEDDISFGNAGHSNEPSKPSRPGKQSMGWRITAVAGLLAATVFGTLYSSRPKPAGECMVWSGDRYTAVPCNSELPGNPFLLPYDEKKVNSFRRIMRLDTITEWSVGKLYYNRTANKITVYNDRGQFPGDLKRDLRKLSPTIFDQYLKKRTLRGDSISEINVKAGE